MQRLYYYLLTTNGRGNRAPTSMALTTLFGAAQLALQDALTKGLTSGDGVMRAPNFIIVSLRRENYLGEYGEDSPDVRERLRRDLEGAMRRHIASHGWSIGGSGTVVMNVVPRVISEECEVTTRTLRSFYELKVRDEQGARAVPIGTNPATLGRPHSPHPRGFIPLYDPMRMISREHLHLHYCDLKLRARLLGRNPTTLNGEPMPEEVELKNGDLITCATCEIEVAM